MSEEEAWKTITPELLQQMNQSNQFYIPCVLANAVFQLEAQERSIRPAIRKQIKAMTRFYLDELYALNSNRNAWTQPHP